jgi:hypothetical protein
MPAQNAGIHGFHKILLLGPSRAFAVDVSRMKRGGLGPFGIRPAKAACGKQRSFGTRSQDLSLKNVPIGSLNLVNCAWVDWVPA